MIESILDKQAGVLSTVLVQRGTLHVADYVVSGEAWAKIRRLTDHTGKTLKEAGPSTPVQILGFSSQPQAGARVEAAPNEAAAKELAESRQDERETIEREAIGGRTSHWPICSAKRPPRRSFRWC